MNFFGLVISTLIMKYLVYLSTASIYFQPNLVEEMLTNFRASNHAQEITGLLLYSYGQFLQYIEGNVQSIDKLVKKIEKDRRHHSMVVLETGTLAERLFPDWSMSFEDISLIKRSGLKGFVDPAELNLFSAQQLAHPVVRQLTAFAGRLRKTG